MRTSRSLALALALAVALAVTPAPTLAGQPFCEAATDGDDDIFRFQYTPKTGEHGSWLLIFDSGKEEAVFSSDAFDTFKIGKKAIKFKDTTEIFFNKAAIEGKLSGKIKGPPEAFTVKLKATNKDTGGRGRLKADGSCLVD